MHEVWGQVAKGEICTVCVTVIDLTTFWITIGKAEEKGVIVNEWSMEEDKAVGVWRMQRSLRPIATINTTASATFLDLVKQVPSVDPRFTQLALFRHPDSTSFPPNDRLIDHEFGQGVFYPHLQLIRWPCVGGVKVGMASAMGEDPAGEREQHCIDEQAEMVRHSLAAEAGDDSPLCTPMTEPSQPEPAEHARMLHHSAGHGDVNSEEPMASMIEEVTAMIEPEVQSEMIEPEVEIDESVMIAQPEEVVQPVVHVWGRFDSDDLKHLESADLESADEGTDFHPICEMHVKEVVTLGIQKTQLANIPQWTDPIFQALLACDPKDAENALGVMWDCEEGVWHVDAQRWLTEPLVWKSLAPASAASSNEKEPPKMVPRLQDTIHPDDARHERGKKHPEPDDAHLPCLFSPKSRTRPTRAQSWRPCMRSWWKSRKSSTRRLARSLSRVSATCSTRSSNNTSASPPARGRHLWMPRRG